MFALKGYTLQLCYIEHCIFFWCLHVIHQSKKTAIRFVKACAVLLFTLQVRICKGVLELQKNLFNSPAHNTANKRQNSNHLENAKVCSSSSTIISTKKMPIMSSIWLLYYIMHCGNLSHLVKIGEQISEEALPA